MNATLGADGLRARHGAAAGAALVLLLVGAVGWIVLLFVDPRRALGAYLTAYAGGVTIAIGALAFLLVGHVAGGRWFAAVRPLTRAVALALPAFAALFLPIAIGMRVLYPWVPPLDGLAADMRADVEARAAWLNPGFFLIRAAVFLLIWSALALRIARADRRGGWADPHAAAVDAAPDSADGRAPGLAAAGLIVLALTAAFAAIDWLMSLSPALSSSMFPVQILAGGLVGALAVLAMMTVTLPRSERGHAIDREHATLGALLLTMVLLWAYVSFVQYYIVWIADLPSEVRWYLPRTRGGWGLLILAVLALHLLLPGMLLLLHAVKRNAAILAALGGVLLVAHYLDLYWTIVPELGPVRSLGIAADVAALATLTGATVLAGLALHARSERV